MAIQLGQAFIALHADGAALAGEVRAQMEAALAEAQTAAATAGGAASGEAAAGGAAGAAAAADEAAVSLERMGAAGAAAGSEIVSATAEADAGLARMAAASEEAAAGLKAVGTSAEIAGTEAAASVDKAAASATRLSTATKDASKSAGLFGMSWKSVGEIAGAIGVYEAIKSAGNYQQALTRLVTSANEAEGNIARVGQGMLNMGVQVGFGANDLAKGMYIVESAGYHGAAGLQTLKAAAEIARQENANLVTTTQAVTTTMRDYGVHADQAAVVASKLNEAVAFGKTNLQDFSAALHSVEPNAAAANIKLEDVLGSLATMTNSGMSAQQAAENLAHTLSNYEKPSQPMINALSSIGLNAADLTAGLSKNGLSGTLIEVSNAIKDHMGPAGTVAISALNQNKAAAQSLVTEMENMPPAVAKLSQGLLDGSVSIKDYRTQVRDFGGQAGAMGMQFLSLMQSSDGFNSILKAGFSPLQTYLGYLARSTGTVDALRTALLLTSDGGKKVTEAIEGIGKVTSQADGNVAKWSLTQKTFNQQFDDAKAAVENFGISLGNKVLPALGGLATWVAGTGVPALQTMFHWFGQLAESQGVIDAFKMLESIAKGVGVVLGAVAAVIGKLVGWFTELPGPVQAVVLVFAALRIALATDFFGLFAKAAGTAAATTAAAGSAAAAATGEVAALGAAEAEASGAAEAATASTGILGDGLTVLAGRARTTAAAVVTSMAEVRAAYAEAAAAGRFEAGVAGAGAAETRIVGSMRGIEGAAGTMATRVGGALKSVGGGLLGMVGGVGGLLTIGAIMGVSEGINLYNEGQAETVRTTKDASKAGNDLYATYMNLGGVLGTQADRAREVVTKNLDLNHSAYLAGVSTQEMTLALQGNAKAQQDIINKSGAWGSGMKALGHAFNVGDFGTIFSGGYWDDNKKKMQALFDSINGMNTAGGRFNKTADDMQAKGVGAISAIDAAALKVWGSNNVFTMGINATASAMNGLSKAGNDVGKETSALNGVWASFGKNMDAAATAQVLETKSLDTVGNAFKGLGKGAIDASGNLVLTSVAGADLYANLKDVAGGAQQAADAAFLAAGGNANLAKATQAAGVEMGKQFDAFIASAMAAGMSQDAAVKLAIKLGLIPKAVATQINQPGMTQALAALDSMQTKNLTMVSKSPYTFAVKALTADAQAALEATGFKVTHMPDGSFRITANTVQAQEAVDSFFKNNAYRVLQVGIAGTVSVRYIASGNGAGIYAGNRQIGNALGNILMPMADGGLIDPSMAQIVPPQTYRVVGDRMHGDEAYIPLDGSPRSMGLWAEAGRRMGLGRQAPVQVTYAPQYYLPPTADPNQVAAMVGANTARDFQLGLGGLSSLGMATG